MELTLIVRRYVYRVVVCLLLLACLTGYLIYWLVTKDTEYFSTIIAGLLCLLVGLRYRVYMKNRSGVPLGEYELAFLLGYCKSILGTNSARVEKAINLYIAICKYRPETGTALELLQSKKALADCIINASDYSQVAIRYIMEELLLSHYKDHATLSNTRVLFDLTKLISNLNLELRVSLDTLTTDAGLRRAIVLLAAESLPLFLTIYHLKNKTAKSALFKVSDGKQYTVPEGQDTPDKFILKWLESEMTIYRDTFKLDYLQDSNITEQVAIAITYVYRNVKERMGTTTHTHTCHSAVRPRPVDRTEILNVLADVLGVRSIHLSGSTQ